MSKKRSLTKEFISFAKNYFPKIVKGQLRNKDPDYGTVRIRPAGGSKDRSDDFYIVGLSRFNAKSLKREANYYFLVWSKPTNPQPKQYKSIWGLRI